MVDGEIRVTDDIDKLLDILPPEIAESLNNLDGLGDLIEVVMDLGRRPEARFEHHFTYLKDEFVNREDLKYVTDRVGKFGDDNRAGIERTLHRISAIRNRTSDIIGLTLRVGRAVYGTIFIVSDLLETDKSILILGRPGIGKTTMLREMARVLADDFKKRVVVVDTSNEIAGDGDIPHPGIGLARRMQVAKHDLQHEVMIEAVQNHMPEVIVVDEIGTEKEAYAARTIAERGVQLIATAHGNTLENLLMNPTLSDLVGGVQVVTLSDEEARKRRTQKTILERKAPPTFDVIIEIQEKDQLAIHYRVDEVIDMLLRGITPKPEVRVRDEYGGYRVTQKSFINPAAPGTNRKTLPLIPASRSSDKTNSFKTSARRVKGTIPSPGHKRPVRIFPYAVSKNRIEKAIDNLKVEAEVVKRFEEADAILTLKSQEHKGTKKLREMAGKNISIFTIRSNTVTQIKKFLKSYFCIGEAEEPQKEGSLDLKSGEEENVALSEAEKGVLEAIRTSENVELQPQNSYIRKLQHQLINKYNLKSISLGQEPYRRVCIFAEKS